MQTDATPNSSAPVWNRQSILELLTHELARSEASGSNLTILLARVYPPSSDVGIKFSESNQLFAEVATRLSSSLRRFDYIGSYSPRQFLMLIPGRESTTAGTLAEKLRKSISDYPIEVSGENFRVRLSIAIAGSADFGPRDQDGVLLKLEEALDTAEATGGNPVAFLTEVVRSAPSRVALRRKRRRLRPSWVLAAVLVLGLGALIVLEPSWTCGPNLVGDILDSGELPTPLPANCAPSVERPTDATVQAIDKQLEDEKLEFQGMVTCDIRSSLTASSRHREQQRLGDLYIDGKYQFRRHIFIAASRDIPGGKLFTVSQYLIPWWKYLWQSEQYCRIADPPWRSWMNEIRQLSQP